MSPARLKDAFNEWSFMDPHLRLAVVVTDIQSHILSFSPPPEETTMVLQRMILYIVATVAQACQTFHRHYSGCCRVITLSGFFTRKDSAIGNRRMETLMAAQEAVKIMVHPHLVNHSLSPLMSGDMSKLFPKTAEDPCPSLKRSLLKEMHAALALACPED